MKKKTALLMMATLVLAFSVSVFAGEVSGPEANAAKLGLITLLPPLVAILLAFVTKNVVSSLFLGTMTGSFILQIMDKNFFSSIVGSFLDFISRALGSLADSWNAGIIMQVLAIGGVIALVSKMGGAKAVAEVLVKKAKSPVSAQIITWLLGILVFFDDYANALIVGPIMRPVFDKMKISREKLAFIVDATAAPIAGIAIISTWIGLEVSLIKDAYSIAGQTVEPFGIFLQTIPYRFYNIFMLAFVFLSAVMLKDFGPMKKAQRKALERKEVDGVKDVFAEANLPKEGVKLSIWNAIIPIGCLIVASLLSFYFSGYNSIMGGEDTELALKVSSAPLTFLSIQECFGQADTSVALFQSAVFAGIVAIAMGVFQKIFTLSEAIDIWVDGMKGLLITGVILILAWSLSSVIKELGTARFLVTALSDKIPFFLLPSTIFILGSIISFSTGTSYGTMGILMTLDVPIAVAINPELSYTIVCTSAVLTGAIFGDHCSPISDTTILSSMGSSCSHIDHVNTQIPYALVVASITILFGYIPAGLNMPAFIIIPISIAIVAAVLHFVGKRD